VGSLDEADFCRETEIYLHLLAPLEWTSYCWLLTLVVILQGKVRPLDVCDQ
jgi:hypothetical protein